MNIQTGYPSIQQMTDALGTRGKVSPAYTHENNDFTAIFQNKLKESGDLTFSKHASQRLESRNIDLSREQLDRLNDGASKAQEKGIKESLMMMDDMAFIVNIPNKTVVTALGKGDGKIITNIDGAVIV